MEYEKGKEAAGRGAAELVEPGMLVGLGTGSTARYFIERLSERCREGLSIRAVASSRASEALARDIPLVAIEEVESIDLTVDGADEIDPKWCMIKGGGGALLREKIAARASKRLIISIDASKQVERLGRCPLPVEIVPFCLAATLRHIEERGYSGHLREGRTDNGNAIIDIETRLPEQCHTDLIDLPGVVETGFFPPLATDLFVGNEAGEVTRLSSALSYKFLQ